ncbi:MAG TPA: cytochrome c biogenesis protein CcdA [Chitinophagaceae bacterium]|nr:cytochrome c biogenesis protein CcdA [Chitinophagaceae bacterium]
MSWIAGRLNSFTTTMKTFLLCAAWMLCFAGSVPSMNKPAGRGITFRVSSIPAVVSVVAMPGTGADNAAGKSLWWIFWGSFAGGLLALATPCVFSLIPITVSFFIKRSPTRAAGIRNALYYSASIVIIYTVLGFLITVLFGPSALNQLASNIWANLLFFIIFVAFGLSFLGAFEISLPASWANRADSKAKLGSFTGLFFMALTLVIVSFSCTGPIIGSLLVVAAKGGKTGPLTGMVGFSLALAIPFALFALFPAWLNRLSKAGGWLNSVKVVLGLLELALALKFLSNVDMAYHWHILSREVFLSIWIAIFTITGFYLLGKLRLSQEEPLPYISIPRLMMALAVFAFVIYLVPGMFGAEPGGITAGFLPGYSSYDSGIFDGKGSPATSQPGMIKPVKYVSIFSGSTPKGYTAFYDYQEALSASRAEQKPIMIDFTGWSCVNCRKMEADVWTDPRVQAEVNSHFILLQLYTDDRTGLPAKERYNSSFDGSRIRNLGEKNADFEIVKFNRNSQPYYVFLDSNGNMLSNRGYAFDPDPSHFLDFLRTVEAAYHKNTTGLKP